MFPKKDGEQFVTRVLLKVFGILRTGISKQLVATACGEIRSTTIRASAVWKICNI